MIARRRRSIPAKHTVEISGKRLQILEQLSPGIRIIAVIVSPGYPFTTVALPQLMTGAEARGLRLEICEVRTADQLPASVEAAVKAIPGASFSTPSLGRKGEWLAYGSIVVQP